eukprot:CAMPEP_0113532812 /NCGR_PEP_ID=MMETSP0015_2-20120614/4263_1 /TAXON_ID=2838 /ORGANISM="Odontella" /LENGTH=298 /DNA_ID=CAMNT_0000431807 /DNA_START=330 /DNA_END=1226 /DNA_ORIENTATION=+ /assembly_acc=CAM_ASM_000160
MRRRCFLAPARSVPGEREGCNGTAVCSPPLIVMGGMAQSVEAYEHHLPSLSTNRDVLVYECLGQGPTPLSQNQRVTDVSLSVQADILDDVLAEAFPSHTEFDIAGFSLGGRIAMAFAASRPHRVRRMHLTGVASHRGEYGRLVLEQWRDLLPREDIKDSDDCGRRLRAFGWSAILATHSDDFLANVGPEKIRKWVEGVRNRCTYDGLAAILAHAHPGEDSDWSTSSMAQRIAQSTITGRLVVGELDRMAPVEGALRLEEELGWNEGSCALEIVQRCGHAVPTESGRWWRNDVTKFIST